MNYYKKIAIGGAGGSDDKRVKVGISDTTAAFLEEKITTTSGKVVATTTNPAGNSKLDLDLNEANIDHDQLLNFAADEHVPKDDTLTTTDNLWSASKTQTELDTKVDKIVSVDNVVPRFDGIAGDIQTSGITVDDLNNVTGVNDLTVSGNLTVSGTTTTINTSVLDVEDANITVNKSGNQATANLEVAGITVEMSDATDARLGYDSSLASKFKAGEVGTEAEVVTVSHTQTLSNKTLDANNNTISNIDTTNLEAGVLSTDLSVVVDDTNIPSSLAVKTHVTNELASKVSKAGDTMTGNLTVTDADVIVNSTLGTSYSYITPNNVFVYDTSDNFGVTVSKTTLAIERYAGLVQPYIEFSNVTGRGYSIDQVTNEPILPVNPEDFTVRKYVDDADLVLDQKIDNLTTTNIPEGTNEYFTEERAQDAVANSLLDSSSVDFTYDDVANTITAAVLPAGVDHDALNNFVANEHIDHTSVSISAGEGLTGGGDISTNRTLSLDIPGLTQAVSIDSANDDLVIYDADALAHRKVKISEIASIGSSTGDLAEGSFSLAESAVDADVTGFAFANASVRSFKAQVSVSIDATSDLFEVFDIQGVQKSAGWEISIVSDGDDSLINFNISSLGQITYSSSTYTGFVAGTIKYRAQVTTI